MSVHFLLFNGLYNQVGRKSELTPPPTHHLQWVTTPSDNLLRVTNYTGFPGTKGSLPAPPQGMGLQVLTPGKSQNFLVILITSKALKGVGERTGRTLTLGEKPELRAAG